MYVRGLAYLMERDGTSAAAEFQRFTDHRGLVGNFPLGSVARVGLARAYVLQGDTAQARKIYSDFLGSWKNADSSTPVLQQAKAEYARVR